MKPLLCLSAGILCAASASLCAQMSAPLAFDVVSIREEKPGSPGRGSDRNGPTPDGYHLQDAPLLAVIQTAYQPSDGALGFRPDRIKGMPPWVFSPNHYDIDAKVSEADLPRWRDPAQQPAMLRAMLQTMLADRFRFAVHREALEMPVYELAMGRKPPKFKTADATSLEEVRKKHPDAVALRPGLIVTSGPNPGQHTLYGVTMPDLGTFLSTLAGRPVQDKTGLTGRFDLTYQMELPPRQEGASAPLPADFFSSQIFHIVQDQLGLQLRAAKAQVECLVIDHVEQPSGN